MITSQPNGRALAALALILLIPLLSTAAYAAQPSYGFGFAGNGWYPTTATDNSEYYTRLTFDRGDDDLDPIWLFRAQSTGGANTVLSQNLLWFLFPNRDSFQLESVDAAYPQHNRLNYLGDTSFPQLPCWVGSNSVGTGPYQVGVPFQPPAPLGTLQVAAGFAGSGLNVPGTVVGGPLPLQLTYGGPAPLPHPAGSLVGLSVQFLPPSAAAGAPPFPVTANTVAPNTITVLPNSNGQNLLAAGVAAADQFILTATMTQTRLTYEPLGGPAQGYPSNQLVGWYVDFTSGGASAAAPFPILGNQTIASPDTGPPPPAATGPFWNNSILVGANSGGQDMIAAGALPGDQFEIVSDGTAQLTLLNVAGGGGITATTMPYSDVTTGSPVGNPPANSLVGNTVTFTTGAATGIQFPVTANTVGAAWPPINFATLTVGLGTPGNVTLTGAGVQAGDQFTLSGFTVVGLTATNLPYSTTDPASGTPGINPGYPGNLSVTDANGDGVDDDAGANCDFLYHSTPGRGAGIGRGDLPGQARGRKIRFVTGAKAGQEFYIENNDPNDITVYTAPAGPTLTTPTSAAAGDQFFIVDDEYWVTPLGYPFPATHPRAGALTTGTSVRSGRLGLGNGPDLVDDGAIVPGFFYDTPTDIGNADVYVLADNPPGRNVRLTIGPFSFKNGVFASASPWGYELYARRDDNTNGVLEDAENSTSGGATFSVSSTPGVSLAWFNVGVNPKTPDPLATDPEEPVNKDDGTGSTIYDYRVRASTNGIAPRWSRTTLGNPNQGGLDGGAIDTPSSDGWFWGGGAGSTQYYLGPTASNVIDDWFYGSGGGVNVVLDGLFFWAVPMGPVDAGGSPMTPGPGDWSAANGQLYRVAFQPNYMNDYVSMGPGLHSYQFLSSADFSPPDNRSTVVTGRPAVSLDTWPRDAGDDMLAGFPIHGPAHPEPIPWNQGSGFSAHIQLPNPNVAYPAGAPWWFLPPPAPWVMPYGDPAENAIDGYLGNPNYPGLRPVPPGVLPPPGAPTPDPFNYNPAFPSWGGGVVWFTDGPDPINTASDRVRDVDPVLYAINDPTFPRAYGNYPQPGIYRFPGSFAQSLAHDLGFPSGIVTATTPELVFQYPANLPGGLESGPVRQNDGTILPDMTPARDMTLMVDPDGLGPSPPQLVPDPIWTSEALYTLRIRYVHDSGRAPTEAKVGIRRRQSASPFFLDDMTKLVDAANQWGDGNFQNGELYYYSFTPDQLGVPQGSGTPDPTLPPIPGQPNDYEYFFRFTGPSYSGASTRTTWFPRRPPGDDIDLGLRPTPGDDVYWFRINSKPILANLDVSPDSGNEGTNFVYTITYTDPDGPFTAVSNPGGQVGDAPYSPTLYVDIFGDQKGLLKVDFTTAIGGGTETITYSTVNPVGGAGYTGDRSISGPDPAGFDTDVGAAFDELYHEDPVTTLPRRAVKFETGALAGMIFPVLGNDTTDIDVSAAAAVWGAGPAASGNPAIDAGDRFSIVDFLPATMSKAVPGDVNYQDGAQYVWNSGTPNPFTPGTLHDYYAVFDDDPWDWFVPADPNFTRPGEPTRFPETFNLVGPTVIANRSPFLATFRFTPDPPPPGTGSPDGNTATDFTFLVDYYDPDDNVPTSVRLRLRNIDTNTFQEFEMEQLNPADTTYSNGATFRKVTKLAVGNYEFWAQCNDGQQQVPDPILAPGNAEWTGEQTADPVGSPPANPPITVTAAEPGPQVVDNNPPILAYVPPDDDSTPPLRPGLEPDNGTPSDTFTYTVKYIDNDIVGGALGNPPSFVNVVIDGAVQAMTPVNPADTDYTGAVGPPATGGADYQFVTTTPFTAGLHNYYFQASDGEDTVRLPDPATLPGPFIDAPAPPPTNLVASDVAPDQGGHVQLQWDASLDDGPPPDDVLEYRVFRTTSSGTYIFDPQDLNTSLIAVIPATDAGTYQWVDGLVFPGGTPPPNAAASWTPPDKLLAYFYVVRAMETTDLTVVGNASSTSNQAPGTPGGVVPADNLPPATPGGISCTPDVATGYVNVSWQASANDADFGNVAPEPGPAPVPPNDDVVGYRLHRDVVTPFTPSPANLIADETALNGNLVAGTRNFVDTNTVLGTTYYYMVLAFDGTSESGPAGPTAGCLATDSTPPTITLTTPAVLINVPADTNFAWTVADAGTGVDVTSIGATIDTWPVGGGTVGGVVYPQAAQPADMTITPTPATTPPASYDVVWDPPFDLGFAPQQFILTLTADDLLPPPTGPNSVAAPFILNMSTATGLSGTIQLNPPIDGATTLTVTATGGTPLTVKTVTAVGIGGGQYTYSISPLPAGSYNVVPSFPNTTFTYTGVPPMPVTVVLGSITTGVNFTGNVTTLVAVISGTVSYPTGSIGAVFNNIKLDVTGPINMLNQSITSTGAYSVSGLVAGTYTVTPKWVGAPPALLFSPPPQTVTIPPSATGVDYVAFDPFPGFDVAFGPGTQLVAYPFTTPAAPNTVFGTAGPGDVARWDPRYLPTPRYVSPGGPNPDVNLVLPVQPGRGYFALNPTGSGPGGTAAPTDRPFDIPLWDEWNMCGNPWLAPFFWSTVAPSRPEIADFAWVYVNDGVNQGYALVTDGSLLNTLTSVAAYQGFWLRVNPGTGLCSLTVPLPGTVATAAGAQPRANQPLLQDGWAVRVTAAAPGVRDDWNYFGVGGAQVTEPIRIDNPPAMADSVDVYFDGDGLGLPGRRLATDICTTEPQGGQWEFVVTTGLQNAEVTVSLADLSHLPKTKQVTLTDVAADRTIFARTQSTYVYNSGQGGERRFQVSVTEKGGGNLQVLNVVGRAARAGPGAEISYALTAPARVTTRVVNITGRVIAEVEQAAARGEGTATVTWSGRTLMGTLAPNGPYLIHVDAVSEAQEKARGIGSLRLQR